MCDPVALCAGASGAGCRGWLIVCCHVQVLREEMDRSRQAFVDDGNDAEDWEFDGWGPESPLARRAREAGARRGVMNPSSEDGTSTLVAAPDGEGAMLALPSSEDVGTFAASVNSQQLAASSHGEWVVHADQQSGAPGLTLLSCTRCAQAVSWRQCRRKWLP